MCAWNVYAPAGMSMYTVESIPQAYIDTYIHKCMHTCTHTLIKLRTTHIASCSDLLAWLYTATNTVHACVQQCECKLLLLHTSTHQWRMSMSLHTEVCSLHMVVSQSYTNACNLASTFASCTYVCYHISIHHPCFIERYMHALHMIKPDSKYMRACLTLRVLYVADFEYVCGRLLHTHAYLFHDHFVATPHQHSHCIRVLAVLNYKHSAVMRKACMCVMNRAVCM